MSYKRKERKRGEKKRSKSTANFQLTIPKMATRPTLFSVMIKPTTERKMNSTATLRLKLKTHPGEDQISSSVETARE
jgi:hypothetical protein